MQKNRKKKPQAIKMPFVRGNLTDSLTPKAVLKLMGSYLLLALVFTLTGSMTAILVGNRFMCVVLNILMVVICEIIVFSYGMSAGAAAVNQGETLYKRDETGRTYTQKEKACCYHPLKGLLTALIAVLPFFALAVLLAVITKKQMVSYGVTPSWVSSLSGHEEISAPLAFYSKSEPVTLETVVRIIVRMLIMPYVNIFDSTNTDSMLTLERFSPILVLLPALAHGIGYTFGPQARARIHGDIAAGKRKRARKEKREHARRVAERKPEQLN